MSAPSSPGPPRADLSLWREVWVDEFDGTSLDPTRWTAYDDSTFGDGNEELACLTDRPENLQVRDGKLVITALRESPGYRCGRDPRFPRGREYTSAFLETRDHASWTYGRFEVVAKVPTEPGRSKGLWPAFWMRPVDGGKGEIDILETVGTGDPAEQPVLTQTLAYDYQGTHPRQKIDYILPPEVPSAAAAVHSYAVEWEPGAIRWYVDGVQTYVRDRSTTTWLDEAFSRPFFLRLNLAVGGSFAGAPTPATVFPARFEVESVRVMVRTAP